MHLNSSVYFILVLGLVSAGFGMPFHTSTAPYHFELARANSQPDLVATVAFVGKCDGKPLRNSPPTGEIFYSGEESQRIAGIPHSVFTRTHIAVQSIVPPDQKSRTLAIGFKHEFNNKKCGEDESFAEHKARREFFDGNQSSGQSSSPNLPARFQLLLLAISQT
ncbi:hypothetical protein F5050DRAFT_1808477 [Lentinula boryana]|uniref:Uncharacterized protein n=1 Tax=Lentinula boryana TaxID=40481 RepID=A0ABQ8QAW6_9AGAR|nr:hypothetical protein F5050DRAFT_1808477 [Lentinula boryana]